ncbi:hypothetical protein LMANV2_120081 [Leptospira interrogans serovar Manilae]|uniref:Ankyrin repeat protein n=1 Tax=Leptospira interrogans serovar Manilae TaxID=214675 RepID=A0AAQ1NU20_LEPIR|nr:hypothetical protein LMANV2_120081 [Leptospira interrogans serovar Manilae]
MDTAALFEAIREENLTVMKKLLDEGCDPSCYEEDGYNNALSLAAYMRQPKMIEYLIQKGASINDRIKGGRIALHNAVSQYDKRFKMYKQTGITPTCCALCVTYTDRE